MRIQTPSERRSKLLHIPVAPTRECCIAVFESKIKAIIGNQSDMIGFEDVNYTVSPIAATAKQSLLRLFPYILSADSDFPPLSSCSGARPITLDANGRPLVTSVYDWEIGCVLPAILSDPLMKVGFDLVEDKKGNRLITGEVEDATPEDRAEHMRYASAYYKICSAFKH